MMSIIEIARRCGCRYVGAQRDRHGEIAGYIFNDDETTGGSFCVIDPSEDAVKNALNALKERFSCCR